MLKNQTWKTPIYSKREINKAGEIIRNNDSTQEEIDSASTIIDNWRASHAYPLHVMYMHLRRMAKSKKCLVVERLKRLDSIIGKLKRTTGMELWRMQDLGGCRCILDTVDEVYSFSDAYKNSKIRHEFKRSYDYIKDPKPSGYRSLHLVYKFYSDKKETYNQNMLIEIQFRTHLQHIWATTLETMGIFTKQNLKASQGDEHIRRFFVVVSSLFAIDEGYPIVPGTVNDRKELISEIETINAKYNVLDTLSAIKVFSDYTREIEMKKSGYYMLLLNFSTRKLKIKYFLPSEIDKANEIYAQIEKNRVESKMDAVLVRAESFNDLKAAYPNYFADITEFIYRVVNYLR
jgi:ppGpp synthetase/RelA/SpoT-type nucleotidyltranferase